MFLPRMKAINKIKIFCVSLLAMGAFFANPDVVLAVDYGTFGGEANGSFIVGPAKYEMLLAPGETKTHRMTVKSGVDGNQNFKVLFRDFVASENIEEVVRFVDAGVENSPYSLSEYLNVEISEFSLSLRDTITFDVTVTAPGDAAPGGRYGAVIISAQPDVREGPGAGIQFYSEIASLLLVRIEGEIDEFGFVDDFTVNDGYGGFFAKQPLTFKTFFRNSGNVHLVPYGQIVIKNMFGKKIASLPIDANFALPDSVRLFTSVWPDKDSRPFLFGRYTAELQMYPGYRDIPEMAQLRFWYLPISMILVFLGCVFLLSLVSSYLKRNYQRKQVDK